MLVTFKTKLPYNIFLLHFIPSMPFFLFVLVTAQQKASRLTLLAFLLRWLSEKSFFTSQLILIND